MTRINWIRNLLFNCMILLLAACNQVATPTLQTETSPQPAATLPNIDAQTEPATTLPPQETEKDDAPLTQLTLPSSLESLIEKAKEDLAQRLGVSVDTISVAIVIGQEFSLDAFYCKVTKERIAGVESPAVVSGLSILLSASGRRYEYHASGQTVIFCRPLP